MEELTREEAIRRHRLMWNWIADETEKTGELITKKDAFKHFGWNISHAFVSCWCCEWAYRKSYVDLDNQASLCSYCPLNWSNGEKKILKATCSRIMTNDGYVNAGLYEQWFFRTYEEEDHAEASRLARIIANLPEKKEVKENDFHFQNPCERL